MPISLIIAIIQLLIKLPEIIAIILEIIELIHERPLHLQGHLFMQLHHLISAARQSGDAVDIKAFHDNLKNATATV